MKARRNSMRNFEVSFMRLMMLAEHMEGGRFNEEYEGLHFFYSDDKKTLLIGRDGKYHCLFPQVTCEMSYLFQEFKKSENGNVLYMPAPEVSIYFGMMEFFGLELQEFLHLFAVGGQQPAKYHGKLLSIEYEAKDIAANIFEYLEVILEKSGSFHRK
jgi:hypothetical protein